MDGLNFTLSCLRDGLVTWLMVAPSLIDWHSSKGKDLESPQGEGEWRWRRWRRTSSNILPTTDKTEMGCAFSSTQIFVIDPTKNTQYAYNSRNRLNNLVAGGAGTGINNRRSLIMQMRQGIFRHQNTATTATKTAAFWLTHSSSKGNDVVMVGQLKSNGAYSKRRPSSEAHFIEHRARLSSAFINNKCYGAAGTTRNTMESSTAERKQSTNAHHQLVEQNNKSSVVREVTNNGKDHSQNKAVASNNSHVFGLVDFQKRLERLKSRRQEDQVVEEELGQMEKLLLGQQTGGGNGGQRQQAERRKQKQQQKQPIEALIVNHLSSGAAAEDDAEQFEWREWDECSGADCCSVQFLPSTQSHHHQNQHQQALLHDGEVSEASFVFVRKRLKVAWEHRQFAQMRKFSLLVKGEIFCEEEWTREQQQQLQQDTKLNNWIPEIVYEEERKIQGRKM